MRNIFICLLTLFALTVTNSFAGPGSGHSHSHGPVTPISKAQALEKAADVVKGIVEKGKLDSSWAAVVPTAGEKKRGKLGPEWVITFNNPKVEDTAKQTLYVFLNERGKYIAANYTGN